MTEGRPETTTTIPVRVCDSEHPHYGEDGWLTNEQIRFKWGGPPMAKVLLDHCKHGTDACYVSPGQVSERKLR